MFWKESVSLSPLVLLQTKLGVLLPLQERWSYIAPKLCLSSGTQQFDIDYEGILNWEKWSSAGRF